MLLPELKVEISGGTFPTASTCFKTLKLPAHFQMYKDFEDAIISIFFFYTFTNSRFTFLFKMYLSFRESYQFCISSRHVYFC